MVQDFLEDCLHAVVGLAHIRLHAHYPRSHYCMVDWAVHNCYLVPLVRHRQLVPECLEVCLFEIRVVRNHLRGQ
jgi:hypothetical protein